MKKETKNNPLNVANRSLFIADNLPVLEGINSRSVDLIYLDPPFNSNRTYSAPIESAAAEASFKDAWTLDDIDLAWVGQIAERYPAVAAVVNAIGYSAGKGDKSYIIFMARRLLEMHRILKDTGSIYLHCDPTMSHSLKMIMDAIFGKANFRNEIIWHYKGAAMTSAKSIFPRKHDVILFYSKSNTPVFNTPREEELSDDMKKRWHKHLAIDGKSVMWGSVKNEPGQVRKFEKSLTRKLGRPPQDDDVAWIAKPSLIKSVWVDIPEIRNNPKYTESTGYPTQKPEALLMRIIKASTNKDDVVLDPFCGCATACVAAEMLQREWIGIDISDMAKKLVKDRLKKAKAHMFAVDPDKKVKEYNKPPKRTDGEDTTVNPKEHKHELFGKQDGTCAGCKIQFPFRNLTVDHISPTAKHGGVPDNREENLQLLCQACNSTKGKRDMTYLTNRLKEEGIID